METKTKHNVFIFIRQMKKVQHLATNKKNAMLEQSRKFETLRKRRKKQTNKTQQFNVNTQSILKEKRAAINKLVFCIYIKLIPFRLYMQPNKWHYIIHLFTKYFQSNNKKKTEPLSEKKKFNTPFSMNIIQFHLLHHKTDKKKQH